MFVHPNTSPESPTQESQVTGQDSPIGVPAKLKSQPSTTTAMEQPPRAPTASLSSVHSFSNVEKSILERPDNELQV